MANKSPAIYDADAITARVLQLRGDGPSGRTFSQYRSRIDGKLHSYQHGEWQIDARSSWEVAGVVEEKRPDNWRMTQFVDSVIADLERRQDHAREGAEASSGRRAAPRASEEGRRVAVVRRGSAARSHARPERVQAPGRAGKSALSDEFKRQAVELGVMTATEVRTLEDVAAHAARGRSQSKGCAR
jgi:hypothetical protein